MARTFQMNRFYPAPGGGSKVDGFNINLSGDAQFQAMLAKMGPLVVQRAMGIVRTLGEQLAVRANDAAPRGKPQKGRPGGYLAKSFRAIPRPQWMQLGKVGVAVRSEAKYHHYVEFGVNKPNSRVRRFYDAKGRTPRHGQGAAGSRYRFLLGTNRLNDGVRVKGYMRDIIVPANPFFGTVVEQAKGALEDQARTGLLNYIKRISEGEAF